MHAFGLGHGQASGHSSGCLGVGTPTGIGSDVGKAWQASAPVYLRLDMTGKLPLYDCDALTTAPGRISGVVLRGCMSV